MLQDALRYWNTLRYLKPVQVYGRLRQRLPSRAPDSSSPPPVRKVTRQWQEPVRRPPSMTAPTTFVFLNQAGDLREGGWDDPSRDKLWLYNLHYFDDLNARDAAARTPWHQALIADWIAGNPPGRGTGWEPYPTSSRMVNWIKWALAGNTLSGETLHSLALQARWLSRRLEWHLLGNHLFSNAKALVFVGLFFSGREADHWFETGRRILEHQIPEQILADGGQFERSPMYHALALEDMLDLVNGLTVFGRGDTPLARQIQERLGAMVDWLAAMAHPDGRIAFFNDAAFGIASEPGVLRDYKARLECSYDDTDHPLSRLLAQSGYGRLQAGDGVVIADVAPIGPDYLPGHAHADTLSFEFSLGADRVIVNGGTSVYGVSPQRGFERSTAAHSTVEIDGKNSSETWSSFRVAGRARVHDVAFSDEEGVVRLSAWHDGYLRLRGKPIHRRRWEIQQGRLVVEDLVTCEDGRATARFHLGSGAHTHMNPNGTSGTINLPSGRMLHWEASSAGEAVQSQWHPEFGQTVQTEALRFPVDNGRLTTVFSW